MVYRFEHKNYKDFSIYEDKKLSPRAYFIPHSSRTACDETTYLNERYKSKRVTLLSGEWDFIYFRNIYEIPKCDVDIDKWQFDRIDVPSMWQYTGYEEPFYVNQRYQFPLNPPFIPEELPLDNPTKMVLNTKENVTLHNSVGMYRKKFKVSKEGKKRIITFLGVSSCMELYINGKYIGYSEGSHNTAEFDITKELVSGDNEVVVLVYKWCNGSYLEAQDMFRSNGIFRDVYMTEYEDVYLWDYAVKVKKIEGIKYQFRADAVIKGDIGDVKVRFSLLDGRKNKYAHEIEPKGNIKESTAGVDVAVDVEEWSAESPKLYTLYIEILRNGRTVECVRQEVGFKEITIDGNVFKFNGANIKLLGVNHHDTTESRGYCMSVEEMLRDIELMKEYNVNAVRTSHYPPDPLFIRMANHYGLYVVDEADIETHGTCINVPVYRPNLISNNLKWKNHYWDRVNRMYQRDKNNACITMWSLGNEAGGYKCQDYCYDKLKESGTTIPIHYEGVCRTKRWAYDVLSHMYTSTEKYEQYVNNKLPKKYYKRPFFQCEYAHAMGVGPGSLDMYVDLFFKSAGLMGGCIWEWADHAVKHGKKDRYKYEYTYGGDHGEYEHDGNFCVDGLFYPDRKPSIGAIMMKHAYRPVKVTRVDDNVYEFRNRYLFTNLKDLSIKWEMIEEGIVTFKGDINVNVAPGEAERVRIEHGEVRSDVDTYITFRYMKDGKEIAHEQLELNKYVHQPARNQRTVKDMQVINTEDIIGVRYVGGEIMFNKIDGTLQSYKMNGVEYISPRPENTRRQKGIIPSVYRAPVDNYMNVNWQWERAGLNKAYFVKKSISNLPVVEGNHYRISVVYESRGINKSYLEFEYTYKIHSNGIVNVDVNVSNKGKSIDMPKIGSVFEMPKEFNDTRFYGLGNIENYSDCTCHALIGIHSKQVGSFEDNYIKPQDSGNMSEVRWAEVLNKSGNGIRIVAVNKPFNFKASRLEDSVVIAAKHREDLYNCNNTIVHVDGFVRGIGSNSCGPDTRSEFRFTLTNNYAYSFRFVPVVKGKVIE